MRHHYVRDDRSGDHWAVGHNSIDRIVLVQVQEDGNQARITMTAEQARHMAAELIRKAEACEAQKEAAHD